MNTKPSFFIAGTAKAGTTSIFRAFDKHPSIFIPDNKETYFFGEYNYPDAKVNTLEDYLRIFSGADDSAIIGEVATSYLYSSTAASEIYKFNPNAKIIMVLRNPVKRAFSNYLYKIKMGQEDLSFEQALSVENERIMGGLPYGYHYKKMGMYYKQVERYMNYFPKENIKVLLFDDLKKDPSSFFQELFLFLSVDSTFNYNSETVHNRSGNIKNKFLMKTLNETGKWKKPFKIFLSKKKRKKLVERLRDLNIYKEKIIMKESTKRDLINYFKEDISLLSRLINRDLSTWIE